MLPDLANLKAGLSVPGTRTWPAYACARAHCWTAVSRNCSCQSVSWTEHARQQSMACLYMCTSMLQFSGSVQATRAKIILCR